MARRRPIELGAGRIALLAEARDEDLRQGDPAPGIGLLGARTDVRENVLDALDVGDTLLELVHRRARSMHVGIDQPRQHRLAAEINLLRALAGQFRDVGVRAHRDDAPLANRHSLDGAKLRVNSHNPGAVEDVARRGFALPASCKNERQKDLDQVAVHRRSPSLSEGLRTPDSPTLTLSRRFVGALRSRGSLAVTRSRGRYLFTEPICGYETASSSPVVCGGTVQSYRPLITSRLLPPEDLERHDEADAAPRGEQRQLGKQRDETRALEHHAAQG